MKREICDAIDQAKDRLVNKMMEWRPVSEYLSLFKNGKLEEEKEFLDITEGIIMCIRIDLEEFFKEGDLKNAKGDFYYNRKFIRPEQTIKKGKFKLENKQSKKPKWRF